MFIITMNTTTIIIIIIVAICCSLSISAAAGGAYYFYSNKSTTISAAKPDTPKTVSKKPATFNVLQNQFDGKCLSHDGTNFSFETCDKTKNPQLFAFADGTLFHINGNCVGSSNLRPNITTCNEGDLLGDNRVWQFDNAQLKQASNDCLEHSNSDVLPFMNTCSSTNPGQNWNTTVDTAVVKKTPILTSYLIKHKNANDQCMGQAQNSSCDNHTKTQEWLRENSWIQNSKSKQCMQDIDGTVTYGSCDATNFNQKFEQAGVAIRNKSTGRCITLDGFAKKCDVHDDAQQLTISAI